MLTASDLHLSFGSRTIFDGASFTVNAGERVALVGDNGAGKSTLMKCLFGEQTLDDGEVRVLHNARLGMLGQSARFDDEGATVRQVAEAALVVTAIEEARGEDPTHRVDSALSRLSMTPHEGSTVGELSGGERRRLDLARTLLAAPEFLLLDEPTNHLDEGGIRFLIEHLNARTGALLFVSHDRFFTDQVATRILELSRGAVHTHPAPTAAYLERRIERESVEKSTLNKKARMAVRELAWLRTGPKARTTKSEARKQRAHALLDDVKDTRTALRERRLEVQRQKEARLAKTILELKDVGLDVEERVLFRGLDLIVVEGERWGIVGANGAGKTTLLRAIMDERPVDEGKIVMGPHTKIALFDQAARSLDESATLQETLAEGDYVFTTKERVHIASYLERWLFDPADRAREVSTLSGGEKNRLLFAKLLSTDANCLLLDEPTNDLDLETLGVLEEALAERGGVALIVSHDQGFLDRVATGILAFEEDEAGQVTVVAYQGDYTQYAERRDKGAADASAAKAKAKQKPKAKVKVKRSYKEAKEYETIEADVLAAEGEVERLNALMQDPKVTSDAGALMSAAESLAAAESEVQRLYARWQELEEIG